ncbi:hypothetical protein AAFM79_12095 [Trichormus azollae HNT15244]
MRGWVGVKNQETEKMAYPLMGMILRLLVLVIHPRTLPRLGFSVFCP